MRRKKTSAISTTGYRVKGFCHNCRYTMKGDTDNRWLQTIAAEAAAAHGGLITESLKFPVV